MVPARLRSPMRWLAVAVVVGLIGTLVPADPPGRNPVNPREQNLPVEWCVERGKFKNVLWSAELGTKAYGSPVVAGDRILVSTNNANPRDPKVVGHKAIILCFDRKDGKFLYQVAHGMAPPQINQQGAEEGMCSAPAVDGERFYYVTPGCVVVCADVHDGKARWTYDLMKELKVYPCIINSCSPLVVGDLVFVVTGNGVNAKGKVQAPRAPSFVAIEKNTGKLKWQCDLPAGNIIHGQWGSPAYAEVNGRGQVIFPGGDGYLYSLEPDTGNMIWKFRCIPYKGETKEEAAKPNYLVATPVVHGQRVYIGVGHAPELGEGNRVGHLWCIDITRKGDVSPKEDNFDPKAAVNRESALVWHYGGLVANPGAGRKYVFGPTLSRCVVHDGLVYAAEETGYLHCLDAATGENHWQYDFKAAIWGSPYWAAGKIYMGADDGTVAVFAHGKERKLLGENDMGVPVLSTPLAADDVLYVTSKSRLYALANK